MKYHTLNYRILESEEFNRVRVLICNSMDDLRVDEAVAVSKDIGEPIAEELGDVHPAEVHLITCIPACKVREYFELDDV